MAYQNKKAPAFDSPELSKLLESARDEIEGRRFKSDIKKAEQIERSFKARYSPRTYVKKPVPIQMGVQYKSKKRLALKEDRLDFQGEESVPTTARESFFTILKRAYDFGEQISEKDISIIINALYLHDEFISKDKIKFILSCAYRNGGLAKVDETLSEFLSLFRTTKYFQPLLEFNNEVQKRRVFEKVRTMKNNGLSTEQIAKRLNITSAEATVFASNSIEMPELFEDEQR